MDVAIGSVNVPRIQIYPWNNGFGVKYTDPITFPASAPTQIRFSPNGNDVVMSHSSGSQLTAYPWSAGFGTAYTNPTLPGGFFNTTSLAFSPSGNDIVASGDINNPFQTPTVLGRPRSAGFGVRYTDTSLPTSPNAARPHGITFDATGNYVFTAQTSNNRLGVFTWLPGWGTFTEYFGIFSTGRDLQVNPTDNTIMMRHDSHPVIVAPLLTAIPWLPGPGPFSQGPIQFMENNVAPKRIAVSPLGNDVAVTRPIAPFVGAVPWNNPGWGVPYTDPGVAITGYARDIKFSSDGNDIMVAHDNVPFVSAYPWANGVGFGIKYTDPGILPAGNGTALRFSPSTPAPSVIPNFFMFMT